MFFFIHCTVDMSKHRKVSFVISNPPPEWELTPGDIM